MRTCACLSSAVAARVMATSHCQARRHSDEPALFKTHTQQTYKLCDVRAQPQTACVSGESSLQGKRAVETSSSCAFAAARAQLKTLVARPQALRLRVARVGHCFFSCRLCKLARTRATAGITYSRGTPQERLESIYQVSRGHYEARHTARPCTQLLTDTLNSCAAADRTGAPCRAVVKQGVARSSQRERHAAPLQRGIKQLSVFMKHV